MPKVATKDTKTKAPAKRAKKDPNAPKRALSAYMFFVQDHRARVIADNPDVSFGEVGKLLGAKWKELTPAEKKPYEDAAEKDKLRAAKDKEAYAPIKKGSKPSSSKKSKPAVEEEEDDEEESD